MSKPSWNPKDLADDLATDLDINGWLNGERTEAAEWMLIVIQQHLHHKDGAIAQALQEDEQSESRSPDGDGLPMVKGLGDGASLSRDSVFTAAIGERTCALGGGSEDSLKPAAGSEPADSLQSDAALIPRLRELEEMLKQLRRDLVDAPAIQMLDGKFYRTVPTERVDELDALLAARVREGA